MHMVQGLRRRVRLTSAVGLAMAGLAVAVMPAGAVASGGGGTIDGPVTFTNGSSIPPIFQGCNPITFTFNNNATPVVNVGQPVYTTDAAVVAINNSTFEGPLTIQASGGSGASCETTQGGQGTLSVTYTFGQNLSGVGQFSCGTLTGTYVRKLNIVELQVQGTCYITGSPAQMVVVAVVVLNPPAPTPNSIPGVNASVSSATVDGAWIEVTT
jgi:hypothetical protein